MSRTAAALVLAALMAADVLAASPDRFDAQARDIFAHVIAFKTEIGQGQVPVMARYLAGKFTDAGFPAADVHILPLGETASLVVRYRGNGTGGRPIALMAHMDVVTAKAEDWERDPFTLIEEHGFFYGRGTYDVKEGVTTLTSTFLRLKAEGFVPTRDLIVVFTGDEETAQDTTKDLVTNHRDLIDAEFALNTDAGGGVLDEAGRPQIYFLQTAEKTYATFTLTTHNPGGHSSLPRKDNAIYDLADAIEKVRAYRFPVQWSDTTLAQLKAESAVTPGPLGRAMARFAENPKDEAAADALFDDPSEVGKTRTTCVATRLQAGHADNALPQSATATVNCRIFPGVPVDSVKQALQDLVGAAVTIDTVGHPTSSDPSPLRPDVMTAVAQAVHARHPGIPVVPSQESGATDGLFFRAAGIPTYGVSGIFIKHSDEFAHGLNERIPVASFYDALDHWHRLITDMAGPHPATENPQAPQAAATPPARPTPPTRDPHTPGYVDATELPDGTLPPPTVDGNFIIGPTHAPAPETIAQPGVPQGTVCDITMRSEDSRIYPGIARDSGTFGTPDPADPAKLVVTTSHPAPYTRKVAVYVPAQYVQGQPAPFIVGADGPDRLLFTTLDNLIAQKRVPAMVAISIGNGSGDAQGSERGLEYDTMSGRYAEFVETEVLPLVERTCQLTLTKDPEGRATMGGSSGAAAALIMAWYHPELYHRVLSYSGTYVNQQWPPSTDTPHGAWEFHEHLIAESPVKPIRIWMHVGDRDLFNPNVMRDGMHDWVVANENMARVLAARGYHYQFLFVRNAGHTERIVKQQTLPLALEWLWQGYPIEGAAK